MLDFNSCYSVVQNVFFERDFSALENDFTVLLTITGADGGYIFLSYSGGLKYIEPYSHTEADIFLTLSMETMEHILDGTLEAFKAFTTGQLQAKGNVALAMSVYNTLK